jgi:hypothetical protein
VSVLRERLTIWSPFPSTMLQQAVNLSARSLPPARSALSFPLPSIQCYFSPTGGRHRHCYWKGRAFIGRKFGISERLGQCEKRRGPNCDNSPCREQSGHTSMQGCEKISVAGSFYAIHREHYNLFKSALLNAPE